MSVKWRDVKCVLRYAEGIDKPIVAPQMPIVFDLGSDPHEDFNLMDHKLDMGWMLLPVVKEIGEFTRSVDRYPNIRPGQEFHGYPSTVRAEQGFNR